MTDIVYRELSYKLNGIAFTIFKELGPGLREKIYADAFEIALKDAGISYKREIRYPVFFKGKKITYQSLDLLVDDKIVIELKSGEREYFEAFDQLLNYLKLSKLKLGLIIRFTKKGAVIRRIVNLDK
ncbi:GxxExxY protein [Candidatus Berkelbacteria bacterium CG10_big_fil_rev_8_21_14_0_10_43_13]|uniref:GxxExxY protein n=1 Tax=Candidatus Berkelbacteria bacterium CG10_big_fil_rev_8_21_14_0_10_43_13 TaxID=1974514 RepID=A0A2H0W5V6_9BACT|nr:MAG: GxxExxY protein [Candidatus Berkelbacteria bacterium CG10_big_fil_rev_8_21_14_0_10_43_13]